MSAEELFRDKKRLKSLLNDLDKADGSRDHIIHKDVALKYIEGLRNTNISAAFLDAAKAFIEQGPEIQRRLSNEEIDVLSDVAKSPQPRAYSLKKSHGLS